TTCRCNMVAALSPQRSMRSARWCISPVRIMRSSPVTATTARRRRSIRPCSGPAASGPAFREGEHMTITNGNGATSSGEVGNVAADAVDYCARAAELLRAQANSMKSLALTLEAEAEALALDIEKRAERFASMVALFSTVTRQMRETFEAERARLDRSEKEQSA